jgi:NarL family two-component system response regulator LiaR
VALPKIPPSEQPQPIRVALVNDFEIVVRGLESVLAPFRAQLRVVELDVSAAPDQAVDIALFDTYGHGAGGVERVRSLLASRSVGAVAVYACHLEASQIEALIAAGASAVLDKRMTGEQLADALVAVAAGERRVSPEFRAPVNGWPGHAFGFTLRESEVAALLVQGLSNREIAVALAISEHTVKSHLKAIFQKTAVTSRGHAAALISQDVAFRRFRDVG